MSEHGVVNGVTQGQVITHQEVQAVAREMWMSAHPNDPAWAEMAWDDMGWVGGMLVGSRL